MNIQECTNSILVRGHDDWVSESDIASIVQHSFKIDSFDLVRQRALEVIHNLLANGLMQPEDLLRQSKSIELWQNSPSANFGRIEREWIKLNRIPDTAEICWFQHTEKGDAIALKMLKDL